MSRNDGRPRSAVTLAKDPLPWVNDRPDVRNRYPDEETANYFSGGVYRLDPRPGFIQDEEAYQ